MLPRLIIFDLDSTLAYSKQPLEDEMAALLETLLEQTQVGIMSGASWEQYQAQVLPYLTPQTKRNKLLLAPTSGAAMYVYKQDTWEVAYSCAFTEKEVQEIRNAFTTALTQTGFDPDTPSYGPRIGNRETQVSFSALGQEAPLEKKKVWDPDHKKRETIVSHLTPLLPRFDIHIGGTTSIDITRRGIDKAYGIRQMCCHTGIPINEMLYVGDALYEGGNDAAVFETGIATHGVESPKDTTSFIQSLLV